MNSKKCYKCQEDFIWEGAVFRCVDCEAPFHKHCLRHHCESEWEKLRQIITTACDALREAQNFMGDVGLGTGNYYFDKADSAIELAKQITKGKS